MSHIDTNLTTYNGHERPTSVSCPRPGDFGHVVSKISRNSAKSAAEPVAAEQGSRRRYQTKSLREPRPAQSSTHGLHSQFDFDGANPYEAQTGEVRKLRRLGQKSRARSLAEGSMNSGKLSRTDGTNKQNPPGVVGSATSDVSA